jgi:hypothetical protein
MRDEAPVWHNDRYDFWALTRFHNIEHAHKEYETFVSNHGTTVETMTEAPVESSLRERCHVSIEESMLFWYAAVNAAVAVLLVATAAFFWYQLFGNLIRQLVAARPTGWLILIAACGVLCLSSAITARQRFGELVGAARHCGARVRFRLERTWRVRATEKLARDLIGDLDELGLGVIAGGLQRVKIGEGQTFRSENFSGLAFVSRGAVRTCSQASDALMTYSTGVGWDTRNGVSLSATRPCEVLLVSRRCLDSARRGVHRQRAASR